MASFFVAILGGLAWMGLTSAISWGGFGFGALVALATWRFEGGRGRRP